MKRLWPLALLALPAISLLGRFDPAPLRPRLVPLQFVPDLLPEETPEPRAGVAVAPAPEEAPDGPEPVENQDGWRQSTTIRGLVWLAGRQNEDGTFRSLYDGGLDHALATLALIESYGITGKNGIREPARRALDALLRMQGADGSWGGPAPTVWAVKALKSADLADLPWPRDAADRALAALATSSHPGLIDSRILLSRQREGLASLAEALAATPVTDDSGWYHTASSLFPFHQGPDSPWNRWKGSMHAALIPTQLSDGSWPGGTVSGTVLRSSLALLTLSIPNSYTNSFGAR